MGIIQIFIPVITFAMGYFLTDIGYKRERKLSIIREKFEKLYHPFYMLITELGTDAEAGFSFETGNSSALKQLFDHLAANAYLASSEGQILIWETRTVFVPSFSEGYIADKEKDQLLEKSIGALFEYLLQEYMKCANALGYELGGLGTFAATTES